MKVKEGDKLICVKKPGIYLDMDRFFTSNRIYEVKKAIFNYGDGLSVEYLLVCDDKNIMRYINDNELSQSLSVILINEKKLRKLKIEKIKWA